MLTTRRCRLLRTKPFPCPRIAVAEPSCSHFDLSITSIVDVFLVLRLPSSSLDVAQTRHLINKQEYVKSEVFL